MTTLEKRDLLDLMDAVSMAVEDLNDRKDWPDYTVEDKAEMITKRDRLNSLFPKLAQIHKEMSR